MYCIFYTLGYTDVLLYCCILSPPAPKWVQKTSNKEGCFVNNASASMYETILEFCRWSRVDVLRKETFWVLCLHYSIGVMLKCSRALPKTGQQRALST